jgi:transposase InsO family protein
MALKRRCPEIGLLHHSDQGCTHASEDYQRILAARGIVSMSRRGNCYDNAVMEAFFSIAGYRTLRCSRTTASSRRLLRRNAQPRRTLRLAKC